MLGLRRRKDLGTGAHHDRITKSGAASRCRPGSRASPRLGLAAAARASRRRPGGDPESDSGAHPVQWRRGGAGRILHAAADAQPLPKGLLNFSTMRATARAGSSPTTAAASCGLSTGATAGRRCSWTLPIARGAAFLRHRPRQLGLRSFAFHPNLRLPGQPGYRRLYTISTETKASRPRGRPGVRRSPTRLLATMSSRSGGWMPAPCRRSIPGQRREVLRIAQPGVDHCADQLMFKSHGRPAEAAISAGSISELGDGGNSPNNTDPNDQAQDPAALSARSCESTRASRRRQRLRNPHRQSIRPPRGLAAGDLGSGAAPPAEFVLRHPDRHVAGDRLSARARSRRSISGERGELWLAARGKAPSRPIG